MSKANPLAPSDLSALLARVRLLALDVDGTLTDGTVTFGDDGRETKTFHIHDGLGIVLASLVGLRVAFITGRTSPIVERRARELAVPFLRQGVRDKAAALTQIAAEAGVPLAATAFMGDDWNDLPAFGVTGIRLAPANAVPEVRAEAHFVTDKVGGQGAVREAIRAILTARNEYEMAQTLYALSPP